MDREPQAAAGTHERVVVNLVGDHAHGQLAESRFVKRRFLYGGEHNMYQLAFAATALGFEVELRGWLDRAVFDALAGEVGAAPVVELPPRRPTAGDLVVVPEGWRDPLEYGRLLLSPARLAMFMLAPPGLFGWPFGEPEWTAPDPVTVRLDTVARPAHFRAMDALGFSLLSNSPGLADAARSAGVACAYVGEGLPDGFLKPVPDGPRTADAAGLLKNRWAPLVERVAAELTDLRVDLIEESPNDQVLARLARARTLIWPSRVEGHAKILWEARLMGCVPVALSSNRFAVGLSEEAGALVVDEVEQIAPAVRALLADPDRWKELSARGMRAAPEEMRWDRYVERVRAFLEGFPGLAVEERWARAAIGDALEQWLEQRAAQAQASLEELAAELERLRSDRDAARAEEQRLRADRDRLAQALAEVRAEEQRVRADRDRLAGELEALRAKRAVKIALRLDMLGSHENS